MKTLSYWALLNPIKTIAILCVLHPLMAVLSFYLGVLLFGEGILLPECLIYFSIGLYLLIQVIYPIRRARYKFWKPNYIRQKVLDIIIVSAYVVTVMTHTNNEAHNAWNAGEDSSGFAKQIVHKPAVEKSKGIFSKEFWKGKKERKQVRKRLKTEFRKFIKEARKNAKSERGRGMGKVGIIILIILGMAIIALLSCSFFGTEASFLGFLILFGGWTLILVLGSKAMRKLKGKKPDNYKPSTEG